MEKLPYELLIRWGTEGQLSGAHVQWRRVFRDEHGNLLGEKVLDPEPVAVGGDAGFPLAEVMSKATKAALVSAGMEAAENQRLRGIIDGLERDLAELRRGR